MNKFTAVALIALMVLLVLAADTASAKDTVVINAIGTNYKYNGWSDEQYPVIDLFGEEYVPLFTSNGNIKYSHVDKLAKLVLDSNTNYALKTGEKLDLGKGYTLEVMQVDNDGKKVWLEFSKDGQYVDDQIVATDYGDHTWTLKLDKIQGEDNIVVMKVHVNQIISNASGSILQIDGIWLIDYANAKTLNIYNKLGAFTLSEINGDTLFFEFADDQPAPNETTLPKLPVANFNSNLTSGYVPLSVQFTDLSQNSTGINWDFENDGRVDSTDKNPVSEYTVPGQYTVKLIAFNANGINSKLATITVSEKSMLPVANFSSNVTQGYAPFSVQFTDLSQNATGRTWDFENDGIVDSTDKNPVHAHIVPGYYTVNLTAINANGTASKLATITVFNPADTVPPVVNFSSNVTQGSAPLSVQFTDLSKNATIRNWNYGDGATSTEQNPTHTYSSAGNYTVNLTVSNGKGTTSKNQKIVVEEAKILPVADFSVNATSGFAPLSIQFTDHSQNAISRSWDFNNDGIADSIDGTPVYVYTSPGTYTVNLTVTNGNGTASKSATITVPNPSSGSSGGSSSSGSSIEGGSSGGSSSGGSSGGGGAGGSPEPAKNVKVKELSQVFIKSGSPVKFDLAKNATSIVSVAFDSKKTVGKTTTIVEMLKNKSTLTPDVPKDEVYSYLNIWVGNGGYGTEKNIENAVVCFKVEKSWIQDKKIDKSSIILNRYSDKKWNQLPTSLLSEDDKYLYFTAKTPGFSPFAITGKTTAKEAVTETQPKSNTQGLEQNNGTTAANVEQTPEQAQSPNASGKGSTKTPGFEMVCGIVSLLAVFLYKKDKKE